MCRNSVVPCAVGGAGVGWPKGGACALGTRESADGAESDGG